MKLNKFFFVVAIAAAFASCSKMDEIVPEGGTMLASQVQATNAAIPTRASAAFNGMFTIEPTAIQYVMAEQKGRSDNAVYDITDRPVSKDRLSRGIYIQIGRKVLVR